MENRSKLLVTVGLLVVLSGIAAADYLATGEGLQAQLGIGGEQTSSETPTPVAKSSGPDVVSTVETTGFEREDTDEATFLSQIEGTDPESFTVLNGGDRAGSVTWVESPDVKDAFIALKDGLLQSFSAGLHDLKDNTEQEANRPVRNVLRFVDPALSDEELVFVRVRERLFEFHIAPGSEDVMNALIDALTTK